MDTDTKWYLWNISYQLEVLNAKNNREDEQFIGSQYVKCEPEHSVFNRKTGYDIEKRELSKRIKYYETNPRQLTPEIHQKFINEICDRLLKKSDYDNFISRINNAYKSSKS